MADELDPRLEARLREALRHEADGLPFTLGVSDLEAVRRRRRFRRLALPVSLVTAAAAVAILAVVISGSLRPDPSLPVGGSAAPSAPTDPLASFDELEALLAAPGVLFSGEYGVAGSTPGGDSVETVLGVFPAEAILEVAVHCLNATAVSLELGDVAGGVTLNCTVEPYATTVSGSQLASPMIVRGPEGAGGRRVVRDTGARTTDPQPTATRGSIASFQDLAVVADSTIELLRAEHVADGAPARVLVDGLGGAWNLELVVTCDTGTVSVSAVAGALTEPAADFGCDGPVSRSQWTSTLPPDATDAAILVEAPAGTSWRLLVLDHGAALKSWPEPPSADDAGQLLAQVSGVMSAGERTDVETPALDAGARITVAYGCDGEGPIHIVVGGVSWNTPCVASATRSFVVDRTGPVTVEFTVDRPVRLALEVRHAGPD